MREQLCNSTGKAVGLECCGLVDELLLEVMRAHLMARLRSGVVIFFGTKWHAWCLRAVNPRYRWTQGRPCKSAKRPRGVFGTEVGVAGICKPAEICRYKMASGVRGSALQGKSQLPGLCLNHLKLKIDPLLEESKRGVKIHRNMSNTIAGFRMYRVCNRGGSGDLW